jgi:hypothetical protein
MILYQTKLLDQKDRQQINAPELIT